MKARGLSLHSVRKSKKTGKKFDAVFRSPGAKDKVVSFGSAGSSDFTKTKNEEQKKQYLARHRKNENWEAPTTPGSLSRYLLWNKPTLKGSIADYRRRFKL
jgi:hypothetical protein